MRKELVILILVQFIFLSTYGQKTILVTKEDENSYEEYSVLETDKKVKHGSYFKFNKYLLNGGAIESIGTYSNGQKSGYWETYYSNCNNIKERGFYKNDIKDSLWIFFYPEGTFKKLIEVQSTEGTSLQIADANPVVSRTGQYKGGRLIGVWEFFNERGEIDQRFNYDTQTMVYLKEQEIENCETAFIGGESVMNQYLHEHFDFDELFKSINTPMDLKTGEILFKFVVDESGNVKDITEVARTIKNKKIYTRAIETLQSTDKQWYPKRIGGNPQSSEKTIKFLLSVKTGGSVSPNHDRTKTFISSTIACQLKIKVE